MRETVTDTILDPAGLSEKTTIEVDVDCGRSLVELTAEVKSACEYVESAPTTAALVLRLTGVPADRGCWPGTVTVQEVSRWERAVRQMEHLTSVNIAVASGDCGGPALDLLLAADFRIAVADLVLVLPRNQGRFWPGMSMYRLVQHLGLPRARRMVLFDTEVSLARQKELGMIDEQHPDAPDAIRDMALNLASGAGQELALRRQLLLEAASAEYDEALGVHLAACDHEIRRLRADGRIAAGADMAARAVGA
jgi:isomerase DpgB